MIGTMMVDILVDSKLNLFQRQVSKNAVDVHDKHFACKFYKHLCDVINKGMGVFHVVVMHLRS